MRNYTDKHFRRDKFSLDSRLKNQSLFASCLRQVQKLQNARVSSCHATPPYAGCEWHHKKERHFSGMWMRHKTFRYPSAVKVRHWHLFYRRLRYILCSNIRRKGAVRKGQLADIGNIPFKIFHILPFEIHFITFCIHLIKPPKVFSLLNIIQSSVSNKTDSDKKNPESHSDFRDRLIFTDSYLTGIAISQSGIHLPS